MKKTVLSMLIAGTAISLYTSLFTVYAQDCTSAPSLEQIIEKTIPANIVKDHSVFTVTHSFENTGDELLEGSSITTTYASADGIDKINDVTTYSDGYVSNVYYSTDPSDQNIYIVSTAGNGVQEQTEGLAAATFQSSILNYDPEFTTLVSIEETNGTYLATLESKESDDSLITDLCTIDAVTGDILKVVSEYESAKSEGNTVYTCTFDYSDTLTFDDSAKTANTAAAENAVSSDADTDISSASEEPGLTGGLTFTTKDINGEEVTEGIMKDTALVMLNFWEPWCGPCVGEMPDLQKLYEAYQDQGLLILGVYSTTDMKEDAKAILDDIGTSYPILECDSQLKTLQQTYVPATFFLNGQGQMLSEEPYAGARSYEQWEAIIKSYLDQNRN